MSLEEEIDINPVMVVSEKPFLWVFIFGRGGEEGGGGLCAVISW